MHFAVLRPRAGRTADKIASCKSVAENGALGGVKARQGGAQVAHRVRRERRRFIHGCTPEKPAVDRLPGDPTPTRQPVESVLVAVRPADVRGGCSATCLETRSDGRFGLVGVLSRSGIHWPVPSALKRATCSVPSSNSTLLALSFRSVMMPCDTNFHQWPPRRSSPM